MTHDTRDPLQALWHAQEVATLEYDMDTIIAQATELETQLQHRYKRELAAGLAVLSLFLTFFLGALLRGSHPLLLVGLMTIPGAVVFVMLVLRRFGRMGGQLSDPSVDATAFVAAYRRGLVQQRLLLRRAWLWYVLPVFTGFALLDLGLHLDRGLPLEAWPRSWFLLGATVLCVAIAALNLGAAHRLGRQLEQLDG